MNKYVDCIPALLESGADINARDKNGNTALHAAVNIGYGGKEVIDILLRWVSRMCAITFVNQSVEVAYLWIGLSTMVKLNWYIWIRLSSIMFLWLVSKLTNQSVPALAHLSVHFCEIWWRPCRWCETIRGIFRLICIRIFSWDLGEGAVLARIIHRSLKRIDCFATANFNKYSD